MVSTSDFFQKHLINLYLNGVPFKFYSKAEIDFHRTLDRD